MKDTSAARGTHLLPDGLFNTYSNVFIGAILVLPFRYRLSVGREDLESGEGIAHPMERTNADRDDTDLFASMSGDNIFYGRIGIVFFQEVNAYEQ